MRAPFERRLTSATPGNTAMNEQELQKELDECRAKADEYLAGWKRALADYQNREKEIAARFEELVRFGSSEAIRAVLPVLDNMRAAVEHVSDDQKTSEWARGIGLVVKQFEDTLRGLGVEEIVADGAFDPSRHDVVGDEAVEGGVPGTIVKTTERGYTLHGKILRPAKVIVVK